MLRRKKAVVLGSGGIALALLPGAEALAHTLAGRAGPASGLDELLGVGIPIVLAAALYALGLCRLQAHSVRGRRTWMSRALAFGAGLGFLWVALLSALDAWSTELFSAHMVQHELLMLGAAPLLVLGRPLPVFLWAFTGAGRATLIAFAQQPAAGRFWRGLRSAGIAWLCHALTLWLWHVPRLFNAVLLSRSVHNLQHLTFLLSALVFWAALFEERRRERQGAAMLYLFTTTVHTSVLGALITFAGHPWYSAYLQAARHWGLTALEDQQLGGLVMWVPGSLVYVGVALVLLARWIGASERTAESRKPAV
ncbi:MAG: Cytochrome c oxidase caa3-type, assembly factor CtaG-related protein [Gammaproteobacteria bacterium]|nr:Cytochrome c oxidase caa3-type, assembly factor CtaG-related protein [Gammaproteobacteria bacterium]